MEITILALGLLSIAGGLLLLKDIREARLYKESRALLDKIPYVDGIVFLDKNFPPIARTDVNEIGVSGK